MLGFALTHDGPAAIRYPKAAAERHEREAQPIELGRAEVFEWGSDGMLIACGTLLGNCRKAAAQLRGEGFDVGVINARFVKPLDTQTILRAVQSCPVVLTVEEAALMTGFREPPCWKPATRLAFRHLTCAASAFPIASSSTRSRGELLASLGPRRRRHRCGISGSRRKKAGIEATAGRPAGKLIVACFHLRSPHSMIRAMTEVAPTTNAFTAPAAASYCSAMAGRN